MPVIRRTAGPPPTAVPAELVTALTTELRSPREFGQPLIQEKTFPTTGLVYVVVVWDRWKGVRDEVRSAAILAAYEQVQGTTARDRIGASIGYTVPEGIETAHLRSEVITMLRPTDPVTPDQCRDALLSVGASVLANPARPQLVLPDREEARKYISELIRRLPGSEPVWSIREQADLSRPYWSDE